VFRYILSAPWTVCPMVVGPMSWIPSITRVWAIWDNILHTTLVSCERGVVRYRLDHDFGDGLKQYAAACVGFRFFTSMPSETLRVVYFTRASSVTVQLLAHLFAERGAVRKFLRWFLKTCMALKGPLLPTAKSVHYTS
jgi:hypothetical protein